MSDSELNFLKDAPLAEIQEKLAGMPKEEMEEAARKLYQLKSDRIAELEADILYCDERMKVTKNPEEIRELDAEKHFDKNYITADKSIIDNYLALIVSPEEKTRGK